MWKFLRGVCLLLYLFSAVLALVVVSRVVEIRSKCTEEKKRISSLISQIKELKDENGRLLVEYYTRLKPESVDKGSSHLKTLKEDEVKYIK
jgi:cell division protein FtsL